MTPRFLPLALILATFSVTLLGATDVRPPPVVVVYPLTLTAGTNPEAGSNLAVLFSTRIAEGGGLTVKPATPGTERKDFLEAARKIDADYYVTGYLTPLGQDVSMLAQVVSTYSGTVVYSTTAVVSTYAEAGAQAELLRDAILHHAGRGLASLDRAGPTSTPVPTASEVASQGALTNIASIFHHKKAAATPVPAAPSAAPSAGPQTATASATRAPIALPSAAPSAAAQARVAALPRGGVIVLAVSGGDQSAEVHVADSLVASLKHRGVSAVRSNGALAANPIDNAGQLCGTETGVSMLYAGTLSIDKNSAGEADSVQFDVVGYDCSGNALVRESAQSLTNIKGGVNSALDRVADGAAAALARHPHAARTTAPAGLRAAT